MRGYAPALRRGRVPKPRFPPKVHVAAIPTEFSERPSDQTKNKTTDWSKYLKAALYGFDRVFQVFFYEKNHQQTHR